jgi:hypothetical protein
MKNFLVSIFAISICLTGFNSIVTAQQNQGSSSGLSSSSSTSSGSQTAAQTSTKNSGNLDNVREQVKTQVQESNPEIGEMTRTQAQEIIREEVKEMVKNQINAVKASYDPENASSKIRMENVNSALENIVISSAIVEDEETGNDLEKYAKEYGASEDKINTLIDETQNRNSVSKFLIGPNYYKLKEAKQEMEQNQNRIQEMQKLNVSVQNQSEKEQIQSQLQILENQNTSLQDQIDEETSVFSLFGWFVKWIAGY